MSSDATPKRAIDARVRVLYLVAVAGGALLVKDWRASAGLLGAHVILWLALRLGFVALLRQVTKLWGFALFIVVSYALTSEDPSVDRWTHLDLGFVRVPINWGGAVVGALMILRVLVVILASRIVRAGDERAIAHGLHRLGAPPIVATSIDAVLALLGGRARGRGNRGGGGGGGGGGRHRQEDEQGAPREGFWASLRRVAKGDVSPIVDRMDRQLDRAEVYLYEQEQQRGDQKQTPRDVTVIVGLSLTMLGIKALKLLPNIPFAPGHKLVLLTPLYVVAAVKTKTKWGATLTGLVMGTVAFLLGDGRYGIFEILKHVAPGLICDLLVPIAIRDGRRPGAFVWSLVGGAMGMGRFATIFSVTLIVQAPSIAFAFLLPGLLIHTTFGVLSGLVSAPLIHRVIDREQPLTPQPTNPKELETQST